MAGKTIIIGAGVIGAATALTLQNDGHDVTLIDRCAPCSGASFGNAGVIVNGSCAPTAMPGIIFDALPDSLPVLEFSSKSKNIVYAFGHQHLEMTLAAISARIIADLFSNREPPVPIAPYRPNQFIAL